MQQTTQINFSGVGVSATDYAVTRYSDRRATLGRWNAAHYRVAYPPDDKHATQEHLCEMYETSQVCGCFYRVPACDPFTETN